MIKHFLIFFMLFGLQVSFATEAEPNIPFEVEAGGAKKLVRKETALVLKKVRGQGQGGAVLDLGDQDRFDSKWVTCPSVLYDGRKYRMWYSSFYDSKLGHGGIGMAESEDGIHWKRANDGQPVLTTGPQGAFDDGQVMGPEVLFDGQIYRMWYTGMNKIWHKSGFGFYRIGLATSTDGIHWKRENDGRPVLDIGPVGSYDEVQSATPSIVEENGTYRMWYAAWSPDKKKSHQICLASSSDGIHWKRENNSKPITGLAHKFAYGPAVCRDGDEYILFYMPLLGKPAIFAARSNDGISWKPIGGEEPVLDKGEGSDFDALRSGHPYISVINNELWCWYTGYRDVGGLELKVGLAIEAD